MKFSNRYIRGLAASVIDGVFRGVRLVIGLFLLLQSPSPAAPMPVITSRPPMVVGEQAPPIPEGGRAVVGHVDALYRGDIDTALNFVSADVENVVSDTKSFMHFPKGKVVTKAMYLSITRKGELSLTHFDCKPEGTAVRCEMTFGSGKKLRRFTLRYFADRNGPISKIYSWEIHSKRG